MRVSVGITYNGLYFDGKIIKPKVIAGDILQAYWILNFLKDKEIEFSFVPSWGDVNHFFYFYFHSFYNFLNFFPNISNFGAVGFNPNFVNFLFYTIFTSNSLFYKLFSRKIFFNLLLPLAFQIKRASFALRNKKFINNFKSLVKREVIRYVIFNSNKEKKEFLEFLSLFKIDMVNVDSYVIPNPIDDREVESFLSSSCELFDFCKKRFGIPNDYSLILGRFDRVKNIDKFVEEYKNKGISKELALVIVGTPVYYDVHYYRYLESLCSKGIFLVNVNNVLPNFDYFSNRRLVLNFIRDSKVVVVPSLAESFSFVGLEALYLNKPLIITLNSPYSEFFDQFVNKSIKFIDPFDMNLSLDLFSFNNFVDIRDYVRDNFSISKVAMKYLEVWKKYAR